MTRGTSFPELISLPGLVDRRGIDLTENSPRQSGIEIRAVILHQTAGSDLSGRAIQRALDGRRPIETRVDRMSSHFVVLPTGTMYYTHDVFRYLSGSAGRRAGIDIEFAGNYPHSANPVGGSRISYNMLNAGCQLVSSLVRQIPTITHIHPHGQVQSEEANGNRCGGADASNPCGKLDSCPGPDIWMNIGEWACKPRSEGGLGLISDQVLPGMGFPRRSIRPAQRNQAYLRADDWIG